MFRDRNFAISLVLIFVVGIIILASMALLPPFLQSLMGYPVIDTGLVLAPRGLGTMIAMQLAGRLIPRVDIRLLLLTGVGSIAFSLWQMSLFTTEVPSWLIVKNGLIQGFGLGLVFVPLSTLAYSTLPGHYRSDATAIFSLLRNIGSSVGISIVMTMLARNTQINHAELGAHLSSYGTIDNLISQTMEELGKLGNANALQFLNGMVTEQALAISYLNDFRLMMVFVLIIAPMILLLKTPAAQTEH